MLLFCSGCSLSRLIIFQFPSKTINAHTHTFTHAHRIHITHTHIHAPSTCYVFEILHCSMWMRVFDRKRRHRWHANWHLCMQVLTFLFLVFYMWTFQFIIPNNHNKSISVKRLIVCTNQTVSGPIQPSFRAHLNTFQVRICFVQ